MAFDFGHDLDPPGLVLNFVTQTITLRPLVTQRVSSRPVLFSNAGSQFARTVKQLSGVKKNRLNEWPVSGEN